jgi:predicted AlkP superfamily phosphohydrolase/phosphomutase
MTKFKLSLTVAGYFIALAAFTFIFFNTSRGVSTTASIKKVLVLGFDGMDPILLEEFMQKGDLPHFKALAEIGSFSSLATTIPPQSPVAWSTFITGLNPGRHDIYDFIARDPEHYIPFFSMARVHEPEKKITLGSWVIPLSNAKTELLRKGKAFWEVLSTFDIPTTVLRIPVNFPPVITKAKSLSGMGTPDLRGTYGTFSFYTTKSREEGKVTSGEVYQVRKERNVIRSTLVGPDNTFKKETPPARVEFTVKLDPEHPVVKLIVQDQEFILKEGEWTDWVRVEFQMAPFYKISGICRFYLKQVQPDFELYISPINMDPLEPPFPISTPDDYSKQLAKSVGRFYTQGIAEDTWVLNENRLSDEEFLQQSQFVMDDQRKIYRFELERFQGGLLFAYFSSTDLLQHMFWRYLDVKHPIYPGADQAEKAIIQSVYKHMDDILGETLRRIDESTTLIVVSDHGFAPFYKFFNLNTWLVQNGYMKFLDPKRGESGEFFENIDWQNTKAYALGLNSLYINVAGRERDGVVEPSLLRDKLVKEISQKLLEVHDPENGKPIFKRVYRAEEIYSGYNPRTTPDLIVGYDRGYRTSWETALGKVPKELLGENKKKWSGDHCMAAELVPGVVLSNRKIHSTQPGLIDIAPTILKEFGLEDKDMEGKPIF